MDQYPAFSKTRLHTVDQNLEIDKELDLAPQIYSKSTGSILVPMLTSEYKRHPAGIRIFDSWLSPKEYNKWVNRYSYSKQISLACQVGQEKSRKYERKVYMLWADAVYTDPNRSYETNSAFFAHTKLNHESWPLFQHFVRLLTDPFVCIRSLELTPQNDLLNMLAGAVNQDCGRLQCKQLTFHPQGYVQKFMSWIKDHMLCNKLRICDCSDSNYDQELLDLFMTGANCTSEISVKLYDLTNIIFDFVQEFPAKPIFIVKEEECEDIATTIFEFINKDIGKKMRLTSKVFYDDAFETYYVLQIEEL
ncbi:hypothetical protein DdX_20304 [Ditylenchus destructor]|uniref:Uncharacterized protein n=1 Tax=Ditylenchus destructor TaxID=166010 RepID=A0AAD4MGU8_9BILA|nr:hypothetical protein DdX_20304 [Ditylenchus destructor]